MAGSQKKVFTYIRVCVWKRFEVSSIFVIIIYFVSFFIFVSTLPSKICAKFSIKTFFHCLLEKPQNSLQSCLFDETEVLRIIRSVSSFDLNIFPDASSCFISSPFNLIFLWLVTAKPHKYLSIFLWIPGQYITCSAVKRGKYRSESSLPARSGMFGSI